MQKIPDIDADVGAKKRPRRLCTTVECRKASKRSGIWRPYSFGNCDENGFTSIRKSVLFLDFDAPGLQIAKFFQKRRPFTNHFGRLGQSENLSIWRLRAVHLQSTLSARPSPLFKDFGK